MFTVYLFFVLILTTIIFTMKGAIGRSVKFKWANFSGKDYVLGIVSKEGNNIDKLTIGLLFFTVTFTILKKKSISIH